MAALQAIIDDVVPIFPPDKVSVFNKPNFCSIFAYGAVNDSFSASIQKNSNEEHELDVSSTFTTAAAGSLVPWNNNLIFKNEDEARSCASLMTSCNNYLQDIDNSLYGPDFSSFLSTYTPP